MKSILDHHCCVKTVFYSTKPQRTAKEKKEANHMIYTLNSQNKHEFYNIIEIFHDYFICEKQGKFPYKTPLAPFDWSLVGVYKTGPISSTRHKIRKNSVCGKFLKVQNLIITCPTNVLLEK